MIDERRVHAAVLLLPIVVGSFRDIVSTNRILNLRAVLDISKNSNDPFGVMPFLYCPFPHAYTGECHNSACSNQWGQIKAEVGKKLGNLRVQQSRSASIGANISRSQYPAYYCRNTVVSTRHGNSTMTYKARILIIEDDRSIVDAIRLHFENFGYHLEAAHDGDTGLEKALQGRYQVIVLDLNLPGLDGLEVCKRIRKQDKTVRILMLSTRGEEVDRIVGLEVGADDYLPKPFGIRELSARTRVLLRRAEQDSKGPADGDPEELGFGDLRIDLKSRQVFLAGKSVDITPTEFDLLVTLAAHPGRAFDRQELLRTVWGYESAIYDKVVTTCANRLRAKLKDSSEEPRYIFTVRGVGYRFAKAELDPE